MNKLLTMSLVGLVSLFFTTGLVAQERPDHRRRGVVEHSKKAHVKKSNQKGTVEECKCKCACSKKSAAKRKAGPHRERGHGRRGRQGRTGSSDRYQRLIWHYQRFNPQTNRGRSAWR